MSVCSVWVAGPLWVAWLAPYGAIHRGGGGGHYTHKTAVYRSSLHDVWD